MAQSPKGRLIQGLYKPIHGNCAIYFYPGVTYGCFTPVAIFLKAMKIRVISYLPIYNWFVGAQLVSKIASQKGAKILENGALFLVAAPGHSGDDEGSGLGSHAKDTPGT